MPMRVTPQLQNSRDVSHSSQSRQSNNGRAEDSGSGAEGRSRKRFQRSTIASDASSRRASEFGASSKTPVEAKSTFASRRRSIRDQKAPLGPRPPDFSPSKSDNLRPSLGPSTRGTVSQNSHEPLPTPPTNFSTTMFGYVPPTDTRKASAENTASFDFLPSVSFDDLQSSLASTELQHGQYPPSRANDQGPPANGNASSRNGSATGDNGSGVPSTSIHPVRSSSLIRSHSNASRISSQASSNSSTMEGPSNSALAMRGARRQSHFPPVSNVTANRAPRKSIGPGVIGSDFADTSSQIRRPSYPMTGTSGQGGSRQLNLASSSHLSVSTTNLYEGDRNARSIKAKSMQPPPNRATLSTPILTPDRSWRASSISSARSPGKSPGPGTNTPSSASKRLSMMPPQHATGLGARTISPTDARRLKRMSMIQDAPPMPETPPTPPTPQQEVAHAPPPVTQFPLANQEKNTTPPSSRTTPDYNRKSYGSGLSSSSNTSFTSVRTSISSVQPRVNHNVSTSRLPTPKPRNVHSSAAGELEEVPPVPAIPKAYESPKETLSPKEALQHPLSLALKSSFSSLKRRDSNSVTSPVPSYYAATPIRERESASEDIDPGDASGRAVETASESENASMVTPNANNQRRLQPLRLPPLNLPPLSTPTVAKVSALQDRPFASDGSGLTTPPPKRGTAKTPSTPMTASKATFFSRGVRPQEVSVSSYAPKRSTSSHHVTRAESATLVTASSSGSSPTSAPSDDGLSGRHTMTPYISSSLPPSSGEINYLRSRPSGEYNTINIATEVRATRVHGPRAQIQSGNALVATRAESDARPSSPPSADASSGTSLRRKLSLGFKRSSSKASIASSERAAEESRQQSQSNDMPPPKLPASATWTGASVTSPSPSTKNSSYMQDRRRKSSVASLTNGHERTKSDNWGTGLATVRNLKKDTLQSEPALAGPSSSKPPSSIHTTMQKMLSSKGSLASIKSRPQDLTQDRDDQSAEEEMKKLAAKRRDFETAAKEYDTLKKRAIPRERILPAQALRTMNLNIFERGEIVDYKDVYFGGALGAKKHVGDLSPQAANFGYDDERGDYNVVNGDHLAYRYEIIDILGKGSFGQVVRCIDHKNGGLVAVKIIRNKKRFHHQALVEVNILQLLRDWDPQNQHSMVNFTQSFYFRGHLCISTELLGMNLYEFIKAHEFKGFSLKLIRRFTKQLLSSLVLLKAHKVIHCDLKPENVLLAHPTRSEIKVIDFGSSCFENEKVYTYIQSRFYRSPEVILGMTYGLPIDMWSLGCILAELHTGCPIFPGENEQEQLACIMEVFGPPERHLIEKSSRKKLFFDSLGKPRLTVSSKGRRRRPNTKTLQQALKSDDEAFLDFIAKCLKWDPERRLKPEEAMQHEFVTGIRKPRGGRVQQSTSESLVKRYNSVHTPAGSRPLPEPPATSFKNGTAVRQRDPSPSKGAGPKRHSTVGVRPSAGVKRTSTGAAIGSNLPRVTSKAIPIRPEMAAAAAALATSGIRTPATRT